MKTFGEEDLIAYHLGELSWWKRMLLSRRLERDMELAAESEEIANALRVFSCEATPTVSEAMLDRSWQRVRGSLGVLDAPRRSRRWQWAAASAAVVALIVFAALIATLRIPEMQGPTDTAESSSTPLQAWSRSLLKELHGHRSSTELYNHRPGPLTTAPADAVAEDPALAAHLDTAERVLTEVSHADGPLEPETRDQVHRLLLENAVYYQSAEQHGDMQTAAVISDLGRVLISLDAEPLSAEETRHESNPDVFRLQINLGNVLFDLRILHHNDSSS
jgi:hypothetical protein